MAEPRRHLSFLLVCQAGGDSPAEYNFPGSGTLLVRSMPMKAGTL